MRTSIILSTLVMLLAPVGCGGQKESANGSAGAQQAVPAPKIDLHSAVVLDDLEAIRQHVKAGSDLNVLEPSRASTPLITAAALGRPEAAKMLIEEGADLDYQNNDGSTALHTAALFCHVEIVKALLEHGADKTLKNNTGKTALEIVELPFDVIKPAYDALQVALKPAGVVLDYEYLKTTRPKVAEILRTEEKEAE